MHHFFVPPQAIIGDELNFPEPIGRQIMRVLRLKEGDSVVVLDNTGSAYEVVLHLDGQVITGRITTRSICDTEPVVHIRLMACVSQREKYEWILQKGTELGVSEFLPVISQRTLVQKASAIDKKRQRWESIIQEAAEQSHRGKLPSLLPVMLLGEALQVNPLNSINLIAHTGTNIRSLKSVLNETDAQSFNLLVGPEGGFSENEMEEAFQAGFSPVSLGKRVLRMETAALAIVNAVLYHSSSS